MVLFVPCAVCFSCLSRLAIQELLCKFFQAVISSSPDDLLMCVYLCCNKLAPAYMGLELGIGDTLLIKALAEASGTVGFSL
jgi:DNA ligase-1